MRKSEMRRLAAQMARRKAAGRSGRIRRAA
jgi:hypothetical protein